MSTAVINLKWERWSWWTFQKPRCCIPALVKWSCHMPSTYLSLYLKRNWSFVGICWESRGTPFKSLGKFQAWNLLQIIEAHSSYIVMTFTNSWPKFTSMKSLNIISMDRHKTFRRPKCEMMRWPSRKVVARICLEKASHSEDTHQVTSHPSIPVYHRLNSFRPAVGESYHTWRQNQTLT